MALNAKADEVLGKLSVGLKSLERGLARVEHGQIDPAGVGGAVGTAVGLVPGGQAFAPLAGLLATAAVGIWGAIANKKRKDAEADAATKFRQLTEVVKSVEALYEGQSKPKEDVLLLASAQSMDTREVVEKLTK
jgi:hypothetical protein